MSTKIITSNALLAAVYVALTLVNPVSYGVVQFRVSEVVAVIPFYDRQFINGAILGVAIANIQSPLGMMDVFIGVLISLIAYSVSKYIQSPYLCAALYSLLCGIFVGLELFYVAGIPFWLSFISVGLSQLVITLAACPVIAKLVGVVNGGVKV